MNDILLDIRRVTKATVVFVTHSITEAFISRTSAGLYDPAGSNRPPVTGRLPLSAVAEIRYTEHFCEFQMSASIALGVTKVPALPPV